jgi:hypothetical protein
MLLSASSIASANWALEITSRQCAALRSAVLWHAGDRARGLLFASRDIDRTGWLKAGVVNNSFQAVQLAVRHFDFDYEAIAMGGNANTEACDRLTGQFWQVVDGYFHTALVTGEIPR